VTAWTAKHNQITSGRKSHERRDVTLISTTIFYHAGGRTSLAPLAAVEYLEAALAFARNHGFGMPIAQVRFVEPACRLHRSSGELSSHGSCTAAPGRDMDTLHRPI